MYTFGWPSQSQFRVMLMEIEPPKFLCKHVPPMDFIVDQKMENKILLNHYLLERTMEIDPVTL